MEAVRAVARRPLAALSALTGRARLAQLTRCRACQRRRKEKDAEDVEDVELGRASDADGCLVRPNPSTSSGPKSSPPLTPLHLANGQDADERASVAFGAVDVPSWQVPKLVVECSQRPGARIHRGTSVILPDAGHDLIAGIVSHLPTLLQLKPVWHLAYSMAVDGVSLRTLYRQLRDAGPCILVAEDSSSCIFGAFLAEGLRPGCRCNDSHECFLFKYPRTAGAWRTEVYGVVQAAQGSAQVASQRQQEEEPCGDHWANYHQTLKKCQAWTAGAPHTSGVFCDDLGIVVGLDGPALFIDQNLLRGVSWPSAAFASPCLAASGPDFVVRNLEVWQWES